MRLQMLRSENYSNITELTQLVERNAFPQGSVAMVMRGELDLNLIDREFTDLYPNLGQQAENPGQLELLKRATLKLKPGMRMIVNRRTGKD